MSSRSVPSLGHDVKARIVRFLPIGILMAIRVVAPIRDPSSEGWTALLYVGLSLAFLLLILGIADALGTRLLDRFAPPTLSSAERSVFGFALGSGALAYLLLGMGLAGLLTTTAVTVLLIALSFWLSPSLARLVGRIRTLPMQALRLWNRSDGLERTIAISALAIAGLAFLHSLTPPSDYDGLMYHLLGPKLFLEAGRIIPSTDNGYIQGPFAIEMLFTLGMAFRDDVFPKLVHYCYGLLFVGATYVVARRWLSNRGSWLAVAVLLGIPTIPVWAGFAYIDLGWSAFEFLALAGVVVWRDERDSRWLVLAGSMLGLALGSKYLGLFGAAVLGPLVLLSANEIDWRARLRNMVTFLLPAAVIAGPWYLKNTLWFGNPVYPFVFGGPGWDETRLELYTSYLGSFGTGRQLLDYLLLPWNVYAHHDRFGSVMNQIDIPSVLFPLVLLLPWRGSKPAVRTLLIVAVIRILLWSAGSQQIRFLLPIYPALSIGTAHVIERISFSRRSSRSMAPLAALAAGLTSITLFYQVRIAVDYRLVPVIIGSESREAFLSRTVRDYPAMQAALGLIPPPDRLLLLGDGRGYYCAPWCIPDPDHFRWAAAIAGLPDEASLGSWFRTQGISHVLLSWEDLDFFLQHDPRGVMERATRSLIEWREAGCLQPEFTDEWTALYRVAC